MKEEYIENDICEYLRLQGVSVEKIISEWFYDSNRKIYRKRKSNFVRTGSSDIHATLPPYWQWLYIEVKKPEEMKFFDRTQWEIEQALRESSARDTSKYQRAISQITYLAEKRCMGAIAFFASSIGEVREKLIASGVQVD